MDQSKENNSHISTMVTETFELIKQTYQYHNAAHSDRPIDSMTTESNLAFPQKKDGDTRVSEQELRFAFVEVFNRYVKRKGLNWFYTVELPTRENYSFTGASSRNALFDLAILDSNFKRIALIEFKANNPDKKCYVKDLQKLANPKEEDTYTVKYFIQIVANHDTSTIKSIDKKTNGDNNLLPETFNPIHIRTYSLSKGKEIINKTIV